ncbi:hypothetical protein C0993_004631 [Termitomyces sp. T159_Od127]|nr:hypothetical protein C0993_004631 [Termitomyces sp. T159_Od127]
MHIDPETYLANYAFGMFGTWDDEAGDYSLPPVWNGLPSGPGEEDDIDAIPHNIPLEILKFGIQNILELSTSLPDTDFVNPGPQDDICGHWAGYLFKKNDASTHRGLTCLFFNNVPNDKGNMSGTGATYLCSQQLTYVITEGEEAEKRVDFLLVDDYDGYWVRCTGSLNVTTASMTGSWHSCEDAEDWYSCPPTKLGHGRESYEYDPEKGDRESGTFFFSRTPASLYRFRYDKKAFEERPAKARWDFACAATLHTVRRRCLNRRYTMSQLQDSRRFIGLRLKDDLDDRQRDIDRLTDAEDKELTDLECRICPSVSRFYYSIVVYLYDRVPYHP